MEQQTTNRVLMVRPVCFAFNEDTALSNAFQQRAEGGDNDRLQQQAAQEFDAYADLLRSCGIAVSVLQDTPEPFTPDSIFPNNCFSTHAWRNPATGLMERTLVWYPMCAPNRRLERTKLRAVLRENDFDRVVDLTSLESQGMFLEGTGSLVLDRVGRVAFASLSARTHAEVLRQWTSQLGYRLCAFHSQDADGTAIYHTNVMMHIGTRMAVVCLQAVADPSERQQLVAQLEACGKEIVEISPEQMEQMAGNMLELCRPNGEKLLVMSQSARQSLTPGQLSMLRQDAQFACPDITVIEQIGGGSARCMLAELFV